jgi:hypothetical protein
VVGHFLVDVSLVECAAAELVEFGAFLRRLLPQGLAGVVVLGCDLELLYQAERFLIHCLVITDHVLGEGDHLLVLALLQRLLRSLDVDLPCGIGDMGEALPKRSACSSAIRLPASTSRLKRCCSARLRRHTGVAPQQLHRHMGRDGVTPRPENSAGPEAVPGAVRNVG